MGVQRGGYRNTHKAYRGQSGRPARNRKCPFKKRRGFSLFSFFTHSFWHGEKFFTWIVEPLTLRVRFHWFDAIETIPLTRCHWFDSIDPIPWIRFHWFDYIYSMPFIRCHWFDSLIRCHWSDSIDSIPWIRFHWFDSFIRSIDSIHWLDSLIPFIDWIDWFHCLIHSLIPFIDSIHLNDTPHRADDTPFMIPFIDS